MIQFTEQMALLGNYMIKRDWLLCGPLASLVLLCGISILPHFVPGYSQIHQTVSEIGEVGSPAQSAFSIMLLTVAVLSVLFAIAIYRISAERGHGPAGACFVGFFSISAAGIALNPFPYPLHNIFGLSELIVYQAPLVVALQWRNDADATQLVRFCWVCFALLWISLAVNFLIFFRESELWHFIKPSYGLIQRSLFLILCCWLAGTGLLLRQLSEARSRGSVAARG